MNSIQSVVHLGQKQVIAVDITFGNLLFLLPTPLAAVVVDGVQLLAMFNAALHLYMYVYMYNIHIHNVKQHSSSTVKLSVVSGSDLVKRTNSRYNNNNNNDTQTVVWDAQGVITFIYDGHTSEHFPRYQSFIIKYLRPLSHFIYLLYLQEQV